MMMPGITMTKLLRFAGVSRSTWYFRNKIKPEDLRSANKGRPLPGYTINRNGSLIKDEEIVRLLESYREQIEFYSGGGYIKLCHYLRRDFSLYINKKKIYRLCKYNKILLDKKKKSKTPWRKVCRNRIVTKPNELWEFDIKYGFIHGENRFFFVLAFVDVYSRKVVGSYVGSRCQSGDLIFTLNEALLREGTNDFNALTVRSDNGPQMSSKNFYNYLEKLENKLSHEFIPPATPNKNAHVESFFSILEIEFMQPRYFMTLSDAYEQTNNFIKFYNERRIHKSLKYRSPNEVLLAYSKGEVLGINPVSL